IRHVEEAKMFGRQNSGDLVCEIYRVRWSNDLIVNDPDRFASPGLSQHCLHKIPAFAAAACRPIQATGPDQEMAPRGGPDEEFTSQFRVCIDAQRKRFAAFRIWLARFAVEDIIRADMDEDGIQIVRDPYEVQNREDIDRIRQFGLSFAIVDAM